jgi:hypothetical protein
MAAVGCGGTSIDVATVKGIVKLDEKPLAGARVLFCPDAKDLPCSTAETKDDGSFELAVSRTRQGAVPGKHSVRITTARVTSDAQGNETNHDELLPSRYNAKSEIAYDVKRGTNRFEIDLKSDRTATARR